MGDVRICFAVGSTCWALFRIHRSKWPWRAWPLHTKTSSPQPVLGVGLDALPMVEVPQVRRAVWNCPFASSFCPGPSSRVQYQLVGQVLDDSHCWVLTSPQQCCLALTASWGMLSPGEGPGNDCIDESGPWVWPCTWTVACCCHIVLCSKAHTLQPPSGCVCTRLHPESTCPLSPGLCASSWMTAALAS